MSSSTNYVNDNPWSTLSTDNLFKRTSFACSVYQHQYIVVAGGFDKLGNSLKSVVMYDVNTHSHSELPDLPRTMAHCQGAILGQYFYIVYRDEILRLSLSSWSTSSSSNTSTSPPEWELVHTHGIHKCSVAVSVEYLNSPGAWLHVRDVISDEKNLFVFTNALFFRHQPGNRTKCTILPPMPTPRNDFTSAIVGNKIYVIGGSKGYRSFELYTSVVEVYDISNHSWATVPSLPVPLRVASAISSGRFIIVLGGEYGLGILSSQSYVFDTIDQTWTRNRMSLSPSRKYHKCVSTMNGRQIVSVGGKSHIPMVSIESIYRKHIVPNWAIIKHFFLMRKLAFDGRAHPVPANKKVKCDESFNISRVLQWLLSEVTWDIFQEILRFLI